ncbi:MAG: PfkB family carbohydrate kinase [bacterium]
MKAVIVGHLCIDHNISENSTYTAAGGSAVFIDKIFRRFKNWQTTVIAPYGEDFFYVENFNLYPSRPTGRQTLVYENISKKNSRSQKALHCDSAKPVEIDKRAKEIIAEADILFITPLLPNFPPPYIENISETKALKILLPQGYFREINGQNNVIVRKFSEAEKILPLVDVVIVSNQDYPQMEELARQWVIGNNLTVIVTLAEKGALILNKEGESLVPTTPVPAEEIVDSIGSGDIFSAAFAYNYFQTKNLEAAVRFANELARQYLFRTSGETII